ncbi:ABC transporter ATP-binding protein [Paenibacillus sp. J2TS4]|uniref:ABC transporter ATP-binding protein n=1 Tax=Paenibacillus sp. J2TS4 TaxID=2807194 RepID=UPI001B2AB220|nr:ABC transporter ATP-binding protein [Paenibacillus sp. J2TS4]GIP35120.1 ABC transporter ATP-binding protein [Paenibacillus sp. J2TS4]
MSSDLMIEAINISKIYQIYDKPSMRLKQFIAGNKRKLYKEFVALNKINISVTKGTTVGIVGRNGSGKSTLLQIIAGTLNPTFGEVNVKGRVAALLELGAGFNPEFTGKENIYLNASILGLEQNEVKKRYNEILEFSEIGNFIDQPVKTYSSGMFVRLAFSVITLTDPDIIIIDEALSVGDEKFQRKCYNHLDSLKERGCTILFVSHSMKTVEQICDYAYLLDGGQLIGEGEPKEVIDKYHLLLYSQENDHLKLINNKKEESGSTVMIENKIQEDTDFVFDTHQQPTKIGQVSLYDSSGQESYVYNSGDLCRISIKIDSTLPQNDISVGIKLKTTHGIEVYGTSTIYYDDMKIDIDQNSTLTVVFEQHVSLVPGSYHLSIAVAKKVGKNDMIYLDKLSDYLLIKIEEIPLTGTGIANLKSSIQVLEG